MKQLVIDFFMSTSIVSLFSDFRADPAGYNKQRDELWEDFEKNHQDEYKEMQQRLKAMEVAPPKSLTESDKQRKIQDILNRIGSQVIVNGHFPLESVIDILLQKPCHV